MRQRLHPLLLHLSCNSGFLHIFTSSHLHNASHQITSYWFTLLLQSSSVAWMTEEVKRMQNWDIFRLGLKKEFNTHERS
jgi:hypothetical protein